MFLSRYYFIIPCAFVYYFQMHWCYDECSKKKKRRIRKIPVNLESGKSGIALVLFFFFFRFTCAEWEEFLEVQVSKYGWCVWYFRMSLVKWREQKRMEMLGTEQVSYRVKLRMSVAMRVESGLGQTWLYSFFPREKPLDVWLPLLHTTLITHPHNHTL